MNHSTFISQLHRITRQMTLQNFSKIAIHEWTFLKNKMNLINLDN